MIAKITTGVKIVVETNFQEKVSNPLFDQYIFAYRITIENFNEFPVQLISRHWYIFDSIAGKHEIEGEGVVGAKPVLFQDANYQYISGCNLKSDFGTMHGYYVFENIRTSETFKVEIPRFQLASSSKTN
jgi:ApaG protein